MHDNRHPGMREFSLMGADDYVDETFSDIAKLAAQCHFSNCNHDKEIKCAVKAAIENGDLDSARLKQYNKQKKVDAFQTRREYRREKEKAMKNYHSAGKAARQKRVMMAMIINGKGLSEWQTFFLSIFNFCYIIYKV